MEYKITIEKLYENVESDLKKYLDFYSNADNILANQMRNLLGLDENKTNNEIQEALNKLKDEEKIEQAERFIKINHEAKISLETSIQMLTWVKNMIIGEPKETNKKDEQD